MLGYTAAEEAHEMDRMLQQASDLARFGDEVSLMRRYQQRARDGASWLIVFAPDDERAARGAAAARTPGALLAERCHRLVIEDLL